MVNANFPQFSTTKTGSKIGTLGNYNLPDFILSLVAKECHSGLAERGILNKKLRSMNDEAIELLYKIFVNCKEDESKNFALYRFYAYASSRYYKCETILNDTIQGKSGKNYKIPVAIQSNGMYISVAFTKNSGKAVNKREIMKFYNIVNDIKLGQVGTQLYEAILCSSVGFMGNALTELENLKNSQNDNPETKINFKIASFENLIYSIVKTKTSNNVFLGN